MDLRRTGIAVLLILCVDAHADTTDRLAQVQQLLEQNQTHQAYEILKAIEEDSIGQSDYDHLLAKVAAQIGIYNEATLALERILQLDGADTLVRVELAKNFAALGNYDQAKFQLDKVCNATSNPHVLHQAFAELQVVEEKIAKRRRRPVFDPKAVTWIGSNMSFENFQKPMPVEATQLSVDLSASIAKARTFMQNGRPVDAFEILTHYEYEGAGNVDFDYLLGVAALESRNPDKATLALERVLTVNPNYAGARIDMARAYAALGDMTRATEEFTAVLALNPPDAVKKRIDELIHEIAYRPAIVATHWSGFFGITTGRDSNVNNAPGHADQYIPGFLETVLLDSDSVETSSNFSMLAGRIQVDHRISGPISVYAGLDVNLRRNFQAPQFDISAGDFRLGGIVALSKHEFELAIALGKSYLDPNPANTSSFLEHPLYRSIFSGTGQWRINFDARNQFQTIFQYSQLRYLDQATKVFDTDQSLLALNWYHAFSETGQVVGFLGGYVGTESDIHDNPSGGKDFYGLRAGGQYEFASNWNVFAALGYLLADYRRYQVIHQKTRDDKCLELNLGLNYALWDNWTVRPLLSLTRHDSNIGLYEYDRREVSVTLRRDWR
jgi:outer membrane protein